MNSLHIIPGPAQLIFGEPIPTAGLKLRDMEALAQRAQRAIEDLYYANARVADPRAAASQAAPK